MRPTILLLLPLFGLALCNVIPTLKESPSSSSESSDTIELVLTEEADSDTDVAKVGESDAALEQTPMEDRVFLKKKKLVLLKLLKLKALGLLGIKSVLLLPLASKFHQPPQIIALQSPPAQYSQSDYSQQSYSQPQEAPQQYSAPQQSAPQYSAPQQSAPQYSAPQQSAPQYNAPQQSPQYGQSSQSQFMPSGGY